MPRPTPMLGAYCGLESAKAYIGIGSTDTTYDAALLRYLSAGSRWFEQETRRYFFPYVTTNLYRWPPYQIGATWSLYTEEDVLAVTALTAAATGQDTIPVPITNYFLEPQYAGPPYNRIEVDLSSQDVYQSGSTPQRSISVAGQWGYTNATTAAGTLNQSGGIGASDATLTCSSATLIDQGDVLLIDSEAIFVSGRPSGPGSTTVSLVRGVNGTTAASHTDSAAIVKYVAPDDVVKCVLSHAVETYLRNQVVYQSQILAATAGGEMLPMHAPPSDKTDRNVVVSHYARVRVAAV